MQNPEQLIVAFQQVGEEYARLIEARPEAAFHHRPPGEWSAAEVSGHLAEFAVTLAGQAVGVAQHAGSWIARPPEDPGRMAAVRGMAQASPAAAAAAVRNGIGQGVALLRGIPPEGWQAGSTHPRFGELTVAQYVEKLLIGHCRAHVDQARAAMDAAGGSAAA